LRFDVSKLFEQLRRNSFVERALFVQLDAIFTKDRLRWVSSVFRL